MEKRDIPFFCHLEGVDTIDCDVSAFQGSIDDLCDFGCFVLFGHIHFSLCWLLLIFCFIRAIQVFKNLLCNVQRRCEINDRADIIACCTGTVQNQVESLKLSLCGNNNADFIQDFGPHFFVCCPDLFLTWFCIILQFGISWLNCIFELIHIV